MNKMSDRLIILQYILENVESNSVSLDISGSKITINNDNLSLKVCKALEIKNFSVSDPDCMSKVVDYINAEEEEVIILNIDGWFLAIGLETLAKILTEPSSRVVNHTYRLDKIREVSQPYMVDNSTGWDTDYFITPDLDSFNSFSKHFLENEI